MHISRMRYIIENEANNSNWYYRIPSTYEIENNSTCLFEHRKSEGIHTEILIVVLAGRWKGENIEVNNIFFIYCCLTRLVTVSVY